MGLLDNLFRGAEVAAGAAGKPGRNKDYDPNKPHHTPDGFRNLYPYRQPVGADLRRWQLDRLKNGGTPRPAGGYESFPVLRTDLVYLSANRSDTTLTWIGHVTMLLQMGGLNFLTDPVFSERCSPVQFAGPARKVPLPVTIAELPRIDVVLLSHNHYDHLDKTSMLELNAQAGGPPLFIVPLGVDTWMRDHGVTRLVTLDWWDTHEVGGMTVTFVPAHHWSARGLTDRFATLWGGFVVERRGNAPYKFYFAGDTGYAPLFADDIFPRFGGFDFAALPIGAYEPRWFMRSQHVNPDEAVRIHREIGAKQSLAIHWGTFELTDEPLDQPPRDLAVALAEQGVPPEQFWVPAHGQSWVLQSVST